MTSPSLDRLEDIRKLIYSLGSQDEKDFELVFVAENSEELLSRVKESSERMMIRGRFAMNDGAHGLSQARNLGIRLSKGEIVAMIDDDVILPSHWVSSVLLAFSEPEVTGMTGPALPLWERQNMMWLPREFYWLISCTGWYTPRDPRNVRSAWGMNMAFRKFDLDKIGGLMVASGYHKPLAEDLELSLRIRLVTGKRIVYNREAYVWHQVHHFRMDWRYVRDRSRHIGGSRYLLRKLYKTKYDKEQDLVLAILKSVPTWSADGWAQFTRRIRLAIYVGFNVGLGYLESIVFPSREQRLLVQQVARASHEQNYFPNPPKSSIRR